MNAQPQPIGDCRSCLGRSWLLAWLAGWIENVAMNTTGKRARDLLALDDEELAAAVGHQSPARLVRRARDQGIAEIASAAGAAGVWITCPHSPDWPIELEDLGAAVPRALFGRGRRDRMGTLVGVPGVAIVGARRATPYGREVAEELARGLATAGLPVISGMAFGVDAAAHRGALAAGGLTAAILGGGADVAYPRGERELHRRIIEHGLALSELPPGFRPQRWSFPARNRIIAALSVMTVVVQARERSGALITATMAGEELGRELGAVPGPVDSALSSGPNALLADGACVVRDAQDILDRMLGAGAVAISSGPVAAPEPAELREPELVAVLEAIEQGAGTPDQISARAQLPAASVGAALSRLELLGAVRADALGRYARVRGGAR